MLTMFSWAMSHEIILFTCTRDAEASMLLQWSFLAPKRIRNIKHWDVANGIIKTSNSGLLWNPMQPDWFTIPKALDPWAMPPHIIPRRRHPESTMECLKDKRQIGIKKYLVSTFALASIRAIFTIPVKEQWKPVCQNSRGPSVKRSLSHSDM